MRGKPSDPIFRKQALELLRLATLAPSKYNTQPWAFSIGKDTLRIYPDHRRSLPIADPRDTALYVALGCALENILIGVGCYGMKAEVEYLPEDECPEPLRIHFSRRRDRQPEPELLCAIPERQTSRGRFRPETISSQKLRRLVAASRRPGIQFGVLTDRDDMDAIAGMAGEATFRQFSQPEFVQELASWVRVGRRQAEARADGLPSSVFGLPAWLRWRSAWLSRHFLSPQRQVRRLRNQMRNSSAFMVLLVETDDPSGWVNAGRSFQRAALAATALGISYAPVDVLQADLAQYLGLGAERPVLVAQLGYAETTGASLRRPLESALVHSWSVRTARRRRTWCRQSTAYGAMMGTS